MLRADLNIVPFSGCEGMLRDHSRGPWAESWCALKSVRLGDAYSASGGEDYFYVHCLSTLGDCVPAPCLGAHSGYSACAWWVNKWINEWREALSLQEVSQRRTTKSSSCRAHPLRAELGRASLWLEGRGWSSAKGEGEPHLSTSPVLKEISPWTTSGPLVLPPLPRQPLPALTAAACPAPTCAARSPCPEH